MKPVFSTISAKLFLAVSVAVIFAAGIVWVYLSLERTESASSSGAHKLKVVTTLFPLYDMARSIGGGKADVSLLLPPGIEPHSFEPKPSDILKISEADIFIFTGRFMEPWAEDVIKGAANKNLIVADTSKGIDMIKGIHNESGGGREHSDPHIWLDFDNAKIMAGTIERAFETGDPTSAEYYRKRASEYEAGLTGLDSKFKTALSSCRQKEIVYGGHYAFGYLVRRYGLRYIAAQGVSPDSEPTAKDMANLVDQIRKEGIKYVFYEELSSPKIAETIAEETNAKMLLLNAAHNLARDQFEKGVTFFDVLNGDLVNLKTGLECL